MVCLRLREKMAMFPLDVDPAQGCMVALRSGGSMPGPMAPWMTTIEQGSTEKWQSDG